MSALLLKVSWTGLNNQIWSKVLEFSQTTDEVAGRSSGYSCPEKKRGEKRKNFTEVTFQNALEALFSIPSLPQIYHFVNNYIWGKCLNLIEVHFTCSTN